jgi:hypothetical protein
MKFRKTKLLIVVFVVLATVVMLPQLTKLGDRFNLPISGKQDTGFGPGISNIVPSDITVAKISSLGNSVLLELDGDFWYVSQHKASSLAVQKFLDVIGTAEVLEKISVNAANHSAFGVLEDSGFLIELTSGESTTKFIVGNSGPKLGTYYVRAPESPDTYLVSGVFNSLSTDISSWRDKVVLTISSRELSSVGLSGATVASFSAESVSSPEDSPEAKEQWENIQKALSPLYAFGFLNETELADFAAADAYTTVQLNYSDGSADVLDVFRAEAEHWVKFGETYYKVSFQNLAVLFGDLAN